MKLFLLFAAFIAFSNADVEITCIYGMKEFKEGPVYACQINSDIQGLTYESRDVAIVHGTHLEGKSDTDVKAVWTENNYHLTYFLRKLNSRFLNLGTIQFVKTPLKNIAKEDLAGYRTKLVQFDVTNSSLEVIDGNLFEDNLNLAEINLGFNKIHHIDTNTFDNLTNLKSLTVGGNQCIVVQGYSSNDVAHVINQTKQQCASNDNHMFSKSTSDESSVNSNDEN
ncbi:hypothetical protein PVAND_001041 [Polypedilum vanderplanki]|uniref:Uncharacterized protein n=1 Tax=Polypedilum vanderplanki TaxID=319348 RepID=A0A9J6BMZ6_POLVA|nr:hypothetical protein PVAND_001041 [Polypedilum vanderplanki]